MVLHFLRDRQILLVSETEYLTILAPATGVVLAVSFQAISKYRQHQKRFNNKIFKFDKQIKTPVYNPIRDGLNRLVILKISYVHGKIILLCSKLNRIVFIILQKSPVDLEFWTRGIWKVTELVIICRAVRILFDVGKYLLKNENNVLKTGINTLIWIVNDEARTLVYKLVFLGVSLTTAIMWTYVPLLRRILRVWATITIFNLCSNIAVTDGRQLWLEHGPQVTAFGLRKPPIEIIEPPIRELKTNPEQLKSARVILPGNETELRLSSPIQNKMKSTLLKDVTREHSKSSKNSILSEEAKIVPKEETRIVIYEERPIVANEETTIVENEEATNVANEETTIVPNEELRKTNSTSKIKRTLEKSRTNNLQKLNEKFNPPADDDPTSSSRIDNVQDETNSTKVRAGKAR